MQLHHVAVLEHMVTMDPLPVEFGGSPDAGELQVICEIVVYRDGQVHDRRAPRQDVRVLQVGRMMGYLRIDPDDIYKVIKEVSR